MYIKGKVINTVEFSATPNDVLQALKKEIYSWYKFPENSFINDVGQIICYEEQWMGDYKGRVRKVVVDYPTDEQLNIVLAFNSLEKAIEKENNKKVNLGDKFPFI